MHPALPAPRFATAIEVLCGLIARHGLLRRLAGPLLVLIWQRVRTTAAQVDALLAKMQAGHLQRHPTRRAPRPGAAPRRRPARSELPRTHAWLVTLIPETAASAAHLQAVLADQNIPALLEAAPQLRRRLRPLCRMLGVSLPPKPTPPAGPDGAPSVRPHASASNWQAAAKPLPHRPPPHIAVWPAKLASGPPPWHSPAPGESRHD